jgi:hypothetical protein
MTVMMDPRCLEWRFEFKTNEGNGSRQRLRFFFAAVAPSLLPLWEKVDRVLTGYIGNRIDRRQG